MSTNCMSNLEMVEKYIGTAYDTVKHVSDNMDNLLKIIDKAEQQTKVFVIPIEPQMVVEGSTYVNLPDVYVVNKNQLSVYVNAAHQVSKNVSELGAYTELDENSIVFEGIELIPEKDVVIVVMGAYVNVVDPTINMAREFFVTEDQVTSVWVLPEHMRYQYGGNNLQLFINGVLAHQEKGEYSEVEDGLSIEFPNNIPAGTELTAYVGVAVSNSTTFNVPIDTLSDVNTTTTPPLDGNVLRWSSLQQNFIPRPYEIPEDTSINALADVNTESITPELDFTLTWTGSGFEAVGFDSADVSFDADTIPEAIQQLDLSKGDVNDARNLGSGYTIYIGKDADDPRLKFKTFTGGEGILVQDDGSTLSITTQAEANVGVNLGGAVPVFKEKTGASLNFRTFLSDGTINITALDEHVLLSSNVNDYNVASVPSATGLTATNVQDALKELKDLIDAITP